MTMSPSGETAREVPSLAPDDSHVSKGARHALTLLLLINLFNYIDRYVLAAVLPDVQRELLDAADKNADFKMGLLSTAFLVVYMLASPVFGLLGDRMSRWMLISIGVALWSLASGASGLATGFTMMLITRCFVGIGEAAYGPVAPTVISDLYPVSRRGRKLAWFYMAIPVGSALGFALGGQVAAITSWRWAFYLVVIPGLLLGFWSMLMPDPPRGAADGGKTSARGPRYQDYLVLLHTRSYVLNTLGMAAMTFAIGAISWWMPKYLEERHVAPVAGLVPSVFLGLLTVVAGLIATLSGGLVGDWLKPKFPGSYFLVSGVGLLLTVPCVIGFLLCPFPLAWLFIFFAEFFLFFNTGPTNTILANVTHPSIRATAFAVNILIIHLFGDAISPPIVGAVSDFAKNVLKSQNSLAYGFVLVSMLLVVGGVLWLWGVKHLQRDTEAAPNRLS
jgi:MFS family permease